MNRRSFLKNIGAVSILGFSNISFAKNKKELKWISFLDELPKVGQKLILASEYYITLGTIRKPCQKSEIFKNVVLVYKDSDIAVSKNNYTLYTEKGRELLRTKKWLGYSSNSNILDHVRFGSELNNTYVKNGIGYGTNYYWMAIEGEYPDTIPNFPAIICQQNKNL